MHKVMQSKDKNFDAIESLHALRGQRVLYQLLFSCDWTEYIKLSAESPFPVKFFRERDVNVDCHVTYVEVPGDGYLTEKPDMVPDVLVPLEEENDCVCASKKYTTVVLVQVDVPEDAPAGESVIKINFTANNPNVENCSAEMKINVAPVTMPYHGIKYSRWFYADCIADFHGVEIYSEEHWALIEKYIAAAVDCGLNMILVPIHTPPLDTQVGKTRPCVQLVDIEYKDGEYTFEMSKLERFINLCKKYGVKSYEIAHMFSQWGAACAPNIMVTENGEKSYKFGWHVPSDAPEYAEFLKYYIPAVLAELERLGVADCSYFHISDEPGDGSIETYTRCLALVRPLVGDDAKIFDALSHREFWERGLVKIPVTIVNAIHHFLECPVEEQWVYYCCGPQTVYPNSFLAMPLFRVRAIGFMIYKYDIKGFLHWGFNFYNSAFSQYPINPYLTTSGDSTLPSGDGFIVYPSKNGAYGSLRGSIMRQALEDISVCRALEEKIGREAVIEMIDRESGRDLRFDDYPRCATFYDSLREKMIRRIGE